MWNVGDFITNSLYVATIGLRIRAFYDVSDWDIHIQVKQSLQSHPFSGEVGKAAGSEDGNPSKAKI